MRKKDVITLGIFGSFASASIISLVRAGRQMGWGPFKSLFKGYEGEIRAIEQKYDSEKRKHEILFYGASNFRLWTEMDNAPADFTVQNHGFGGSTDKLLVQYAERILYPYEPDIVVFQTGSNDYVELPGTDEEKVAACMDYKRKMFSAFHEHMPHTHFVVMSGLLLPGRSQYTLLTQEINRRLSALCHELDYMTFVDAESMTFDGGRYRKDLFVRDQIHLNRSGQLIWCENYIRPCLEKLRSRCEPRKT